MLERLKTFDRRSALIAVAVAAFVGLGNGSQIWLAIIAGIVAYAALRMFSSGGLMSSGGGGRGRESAQERRERSVLALESARTKIETVRSLAERIPKDGTRTLALRIPNESKRALDIIESQDAVLAAPLLLEQLLEPAEGILDTYVRLSERAPANSANTLLYQYEAQDLPQIERAARLFREHLEKNGASDLKALEATLSFTPEGQTAVTPIPGKK